MLSSTADQDHVDRSIPAYANRHMPSHDETSALSNVTSLLPNPRENEKFTDRIIEPGTDVVRK
jgi:hypothetical protein